LPSKTLSGEHSEIIPPHPTIEFRYPHADPVYRFRIELRADWRDTGLDRTWSHLATTLACFAPPVGTLRFSVALSRKEIEMLPADLARLTLDTLGATVLELVPAKFGCQTLSVHPSSSDHRRTYWIVIADRCWLISASAPPAELQSFTTAIEQIVATFALSAEAPSVAPGSWFHSSSGFPFCFELLPGWERRGRLRRAREIFQVTVAGPAGELTVTWTDHPHRDLWRIVPLPQPASTRHLPPSGDFASRSVITADSWVGLAFAGSDGSLLISGTGMDAPAGSLSAAAARASLQLAAATTARFSPPNSDFCSRLADRLLAASPRWFAIVNEDFSAMLNGVAVATEHLTLTQTGILLAEFVPDSDLLPRLWGRQAMVLAAASCSLQELAHHWRVLLLLQDGDRLVTFPAHQPDLLAGFLAAAGPDSRRAFLGPAQELWIESEKGEAILRVSAEDCFSFPLNPR